ncbi:Serine-threonine/tyrosine-protein kinase, catalytic domain [Sesbania bispinosa]|nr:Serine-threonine/tyrosine-protein kinase, catalytic domain [Sesbania bispinosa]
MDLKASLDPESHYLPSWTINGNPCDGSFEGVACNEKGQVANISLQGKGLPGKLSPAIAGLKHLTGLYLHYNSFSMENLQVLQLCYNQLTGSIPTQLGSLKKLTVVALQSNQLSGAIPANLGDLGMLVRLDLGSNNLFGSIPTSLADAPSLKVLDVHNNTLSGNVPLALKRLDDGFSYEDNLGLCGVGFPTLKTCNDSDHANPSRPEPTRDIPETANVKLPCNGTRCLNSSKSNPATSIIVGIFVAIIAMSAIGILTFTLYRRRKQKLGNSFHISDSRPSTDEAKGIYRKNGSPLVSLEYSTGWDPLADSRSFNGDSQDRFQSFRFNLEEVESATQYFSELNLLGKSNFSATYKGVLRDGSVVAVKSISKTSCKSDEAEFLKGLNMLTSLRNDNLEGDGEVLEWSTRVSIVKGIAKGIAYLHAYKANKPVLVHQNISADKVLIDRRYNPLLADSGLYKLLTNDIVFSALKASAAKGYLAPEYTTTGRFTETSDVYAFGVLLFQILSGKQKITSSIRLSAESFRFKEFIDPNLYGRFFEYEAAKLVKIALLCTHESPFERPSMEVIVQELGNCSSCL